MRLVECNLLLCQLIVVAADISLTDLAKIDTSEVFNEVNDIGFILDEDLGDVGTDQLVSSTVNSFARYSKSFFSDPFCDNKRGNGLLFVDAAAKSAYLSKVTGEGFGKCRWIFSRSVTNLDRLRKIKPAYNSNVFLWKQDFDGGKHNTTSITITEIYSPSPASRIFEHDIAKFDASGVLIFCSHLRKWERRSDLDGINIVASVFELPPAVIIPGHNLSRIMGQGPQILHDWSKELNFTYTYVVPKKGAFGIKDANGTWDGIIHQLISKEADLGIVLSLTQERTEVVDFFDIISTNWAVLVTRKKESYTSFSFLLMLDYQVWILGSVAVLIFVVLAVSIMVLHREDKRRRGVVGSGVMTTYRCLVNQADQIHQDVTSKWLSLRVLLFTVLLFGYLGIILISANLTSSMSVSKETDEVNSLEDVDSKQYEPFLQGGSFLTQDFQNAKIGTAMRNLWDNYISKNGKYRDPNYQVLIQNFLSSEKGALVILELPFNNWISRNKEVGCGNLRKVRLEQEKSQGSVAARKDFPYFRTFNEHLRRKMVESGVLAREMKAWLPPTMDYLCSTESTNEEGGGGVQDPDAISVGLDGTRYLFYLLFLAVALSFALVLAEHCWKRARRERKHDRISRIAYRADVNYAY